MGACGKEDKALCSEKFASLYMCLIMGGIVSYFCASDGGVLCL
jgi:hypothetical protein